MRNWIPRELANAPARIPAYTPYIVPKLPPRPWIPDKPDRCASLDGWGGGAFIIMIWSGLYFQLALHLNELPRINIQEEYDYCCLKGGLNN